MFSSASGPGSPKTPGWLSSLFNGWKSSAGEDDLKLYSQDDVECTKLDLITLLEGLGVSVQSSEDNRDEELVVLKCSFRERAGSEEGTPSNSFGMGSMKSVRFRVEICPASGMSPQVMGPLMSPILSPPLGYAGPRVSCDAPSTSMVSGPVANSYFPPGGGPRLRSKTSPIPSQMWNFKPWAGHYPAEGNATTVFVKHEKGSGVTLKAIWKKMGNMSSTHSVEIPQSDAAWTPSPGWVVVDEGKLGIAV